jgi:hypothetical protein
MHRRALAQLTAGLARKLDDGAARTNLDAITVVQQTGGPRRRERTVAGGDEYEAIGAQARLTGA